MSEANYSQPENLQQLDQILAPYFSKYHREKCYPGLFFTQGKRTMVQINIPAHDLPTLLQSKPSQGNNPDSGKNRPEVKGHAQEIKNYLLKRIKKDKPWIVGTLTANIDPENIEIVNLGRGICLVVIPRGVKLDITDGQHRKRAIHELVESHQGDLIDDNDFPITLVLEGDLNQCQTDFRDMAQTRQLDKSLLLSFGEFEGVVGITKNLVEQVLIFKGKTEKIKATPSTKHKLIYTNNYIVRAVSCAFTNVPDHQMENYDVEELSQTLTNCLNRFFFECHQTRDIAETEPDNLTVTQVGNFKEDCILGRSVGLEILGYLLHFTYEKDDNLFNSQQVLQLAQLD